MPTSGSLPARVLDADQTAYLAVDRFGASGSSYRETEVERPTSKPTSDLMSDQFNGPVRVVAINTMSVGRRTFPPTLTPKFKRAAISMASPYPNM
jgi:hypothetical protein